jgi:hypothetical protein
MNLDQDRVPVTFEDALRLLDLGMTDHEKGAWTNMTAMKMFDLQDDLTAQIRHDWSLDDDQSPLRIFFRNLGLDDAREVSGLLIDAFWRRYNNESLPVEDLVREYLEEC